jgi:hypothetical protein
MNQEYHQIRAKNSATMDQIRAGFGLPPITTEHNKMTKKNINKMKEKNDKRINDVIDSLKGFGLLQNIVLDLGIWRDKKSEFPKAIKEHKANLREKLSNSAVWRDAAEGTEGSGSSRMNELGSKKRKNKNSKTK